MIDKNKNKILALLTLGAGMLVAFAAAAYAPPSLLPPNSTDEVAPLNTSPAVQSKSGSLSVNIGSGEITFSNSSNIIFGGNGAVSGAIGLFNIPGIGTTLGLSTPGQDVSPLAAWSAAAGNIPFSYSPLNVGVGGAPALSAGTVGELLLGNAAVSGMPLALNSIGTESDITVGAHYTPASDSWAPNGALSRMNGYQPMQLSLTPTDVYLSTGLVGGDGSVTWTDSLDINGASGTVAISDRERGANVNAPVFNILPINSEPPFSSVAGMFDYTSQYCQKYGGCYTDANNLQCLETVPPQQIYDNNLCSGASTNGHEVLLREWEPTPSGASVCAQKDQAAYESDHLTFYQCTVNGNDQSYNMASLNVGQLELKNQTWSNIIKKSVTDCRSSQNGICNMALTCPSGYLLIGVKQNVNTTNPSQAIVEPFGTIYCAKP